MAAIPLRAPAAGEDGLKMLAARLPFCRAYRRRVICGALAWLGSCFAAAAQTGTDATANTPVLIPSTGLRGAFVAGDPLLFATPVRRPEFSGYLSWQLPSVVAARGHYVYVLDSVRRQIFRYDEALQNITPFADYPAGGVTSMAVAHDLSLYVSDAAAQQVIHFSVDGRLLQRISREFEMTRPVSVVRDERTGNLWVADSLHNEVLLFNSLGRFLAAWRPASARSIEAMAPGPDGLYLVDRLSRQIVVIGLDGVERYTFGAGVLKMPAAIAVDRFNRVFVSDTFDNTIRVYHEGQWVASVADSGAVPSHFNRVTSLAIDHNTLYVADSLNARVLTFQLAPPRRNASSHD